mmetsp:Transcript_65530/g.185869  ORF Transcript_65530/g.185869 Transcript_65530/m.185869 type:complete len:252 (-) Transcript_65530:7-762(-)
MGRSRPAPLQDDGAFHSGPPTLEAGHRQDATSSEVPVRNTFIDFSDHQVVQPLTAPGKFVGRLGGPVSATSSTCRRPEQVAVSAGSVPLHVMAPPPPLRTPRLPAETAQAGMAMPPMQSPHLPPEYRSSFGRAGVPPAAGGILVPPLQASPAPPTAPAMPLLPVQGSVVEVKVLGQAASPPRFCPPSYTVNLMQTPSGVGMPPPMHSPVCATPVGAGATVKLGDSRCFPASAAQATPAGVPEGMIWPATPF